MEVHFVMVMMLSECDAVDMGDDDENDGDEC